MKEVNDGKDNHEIQPEPVQDGQDAAQPLAPSLLQDVMVRYYQQLIGQVQSGLLQLEMFRNLGNLANQGKNLRSFKSQ